MVESNLTWRHYSEDQGHAQELAWLVAIRGTAPHFLIPLIQRGAGGILIA
jgi:hypothetical protein